LTKTVKTLRTPASVVTKLSLSMTRDQGIYYYK